VDSCPVCIPAAAKGQNIVTTDAELLHRYVDDSSEEAFTELVQRHIGLVYSAALRRVGHDVHLAEDVAQRVFTDLARKAGSLSGRTSLSGWLYVSTHHAAAEVVRRERRRKTRETEAHAMQTLLHDSEPHPEWSHLRPALDEAIIALREEEREAITLRFFEQRSFADVGAALRLTDEAARKRVDRALEKLRVGLARRGVTSTSAMLTLALVELAPSATPAGLAARIAGQALAQGAAAGAGSGLAALLGPGLAVGTALLLGTFAVTHQHGVNRQLEAELAQLQSAQRAAGALRAENHELARRVTEVDDLRRRVAERPAPPAKVAPAAAGPTASTPVWARVTVHTNGTLRWGSEPVNLQQFTARLKALQQNSPDGGASLGISGLSEFSPLAYAIDQARRTGISHVVVESDAMPDPKMGFSWFGSR
jgi:RNA polymerase sigma factor (sigma-70 family)